MRKAYGRASLILTNGSSRVVIDYANRVVTFAIRGEFTVKPFDSFKHLTPAIIAMLYRKIGYEALPRGGKKRAA